jgi:hypothetical protein
MSKHEPKPFLMGTETEYAVSGKSGDTKLEAGTIFQLLATALRQERKTALNDGSERGMFLEHGGRMYLDYGGHPEHATPECATPRQVACYDKAGEHLLAIARDRVIRDHPEVSIAIIKNNLDPVRPNRITYGTHESYTSWVSAQQVARQMMAHLVTRILFAGAGALTTHPEGMGFELSQRARHMNGATGSDTTSDRAICCTRVRHDRDRAENSWTRLHLISKDSQRCPFGAYLTFGTTGAILVAMNHGMEMGKGLTLAEPVKAMRAISRDPWLNQRVALADGRHLNALEIQAIYLEECEQALQKGLLPDWAPELIGHWRQTLADLERDPLGLADRLDPYCKLLIYQHELRKANLGWGEVRQALTTLEQLRLEHTEGVIAAVLRDDPEGLSAEALARFAKARTQARTREPRNLERLLFAQRLQMLDLNYHEVGGLHDLLLRAGRLQPVILEGKDIERASQDPPPGGRAFVRGTRIKQAIEAGWRVNWHYLWHPPTGRCVDMRDPFTSEVREVQMEATPDDDDDTDVDDILAAIGAPRFNRLRRIPG